MTTIHCMTGRYIGLDLSTQQLKAVVTDEHLNVVHTDGVVFETDLAEYKCVGSMCTRTLCSTLGGVYVHGAVVTSPTLMWVQAMDVLFERLCASVDLSHIRAISGAGQVCTRVRFYYQYDKRTATWQCLLEAWRTRRAGASQARFNATATTTGRSCLSTSRTCPARAQHTHTYTKTGKRCYLRRPNFRDQT
jgi:sugar (pentulose or hexulose) kinase